MKKSLVLLVVLLGTSFSMLHAVTVADGDNDKAGKTSVEAAPVETWEFYSTQQEPTAEELANANNHKFGKEVGCLYNAFMDMYVVKEEIVPGDPSRRTVIRKPGIYNAVRSIEKQLNKKIDVIKVRRFAENKCVTRELLMLKVTYTNVTRSDIMEICNITGAHIADLSPKSMVIELTAKTSKIDRFIKLMQPFGIIEMARTGALAVQRDSNE